MALGTLDDLLRHAPPCLLEKLTRPWRPSEGDTVVVAVSGGADSIALLHLLAALAPGRGWLLRAASFDHAMRGTEGEDDLRFVAESSARLGVPIDTGRSEPGLRSEAGAREARRRFLFAVAERHGAKAIALGHTMDDQAETVLMRLGRGCGSMGLGAMRRFSSPFWRPALGTRRRELREFLEASGRPWREDPSNASRGPLRNRVRLDVLPVMEEAMGPGTIEALARAARFARDDEAFLDRAAESSTDRLELHADEERIELDRRALARLDAPLARRSVRRALDRLASSGSAATARHLTALMRLARAQGPGTRIDLPRGLAARRCGDRLVIERRGAGDR